MSQGHEGDTIKMTIILIVGLVTALVLYVVLAKMWGNEPKKAKKQERAEIMRQLLALSDLENNASATAPPVRSQTPRADQGMQRSKRQSGPTRKISQPIRAAKKA